MIRKQNWGGFVDTKTRKVVMRGNFLDRKCREELSVQEGNV